MFAIPGFNVGNLVVEAPKEQLKKRKHDAVEVSVSATTIALSKSVTVSSNATTSSGTASGSITSAAKTPSFPKPEPKSTSTSAPIVPSPKRTKKGHLTVSDTSTLTTPSISLTPSSASGTVNPLKERDSWNRSTKALRKAKAHDVGRAKDNGVSRSDTAVEISGGEHIIAPKKRNKRLERKIKKAAFITVMEENKLTTGSAGDQDASTATESLGDVDVANGTGEIGEGSNGEKVKIQQPKILHPELAKLTNKEKRLLKQFQKKNQEEGIDLAAVASPNLLSMPNTCHNDKGTPRDAKAEGNSAMAHDRKSKRHKADKSVTMVSPQGHAIPTTFKETKKEKKVDSEVSKKQQQLAKEKEKLLEALNRTNDALAELQKSLGEGDDNGASMNKAQVKAAVQNRKKEKGATDEKESKTQKSSSKPETSSPASSSTPAPTKELTQPKQPKLTKLQEQMKKTLAGGKFRFLNEQLYTTTGEEAFHLFRSKPELFDEYHEGFRSQVESWPQNPVDLFIAQLRQMPKNTVVADLGCGDAQISKELGKQYKVLSFDLVAKNDRVTACDIAHLPLEDTSIDVAIFCLSLMGTDFLKFLKEAFRVLRPKGQLKIAEVVSRFIDVEAFVAALKALGFELKHSDASNKMFIMFDFVKPDPNATSNGKKGSKGNKGNKQKGQESSVDVNVLDESSLLKPCIYKRR